MCGKVVFLSAFLRSVLMSKTETPLLRPFFNFAVFRWIPPIFHKTKFLRNSEKPPGEIPLFPSYPKYRLRTLPLPECRALSSADQRLLKSLLCRKRQAGKLPEEPQITVRPNRVCARSNAAHFTAEHFRLQRVCRPSWITKTAGSSP